MLLTGYTKKIFRAECNPEFQSVHCIAALNEDVGEVLPYLNAVLGGFEYLKDPPAVTFKSRGRLITVHGDKIAMNALKDGNEADRILSWLAREINEAWQKRGEIKPSYEGMPRPGIIDILKLLPKTNCGECGEKTCMVFATRVAEGIRDAGNCPQMESEQKTELTSYLDRFQLDF